MTLFIMMSIMVAAVVLVSSIAWYLDGKYLRQIDDIDD
jgi:hypothetical protein